jgi:hypothetical protein
VKRISFINGITMGFLDFYLAKVLFLPRLC